MLMTELVVRILAGWRIAFALRRVYRSSRPSAGEDMLRVHEVPVPQFIQQYPEAALPNSPVGFLNDAGIIWAMKHREIIITNYGTSTTDDGKRDEIQDNEIEESITPVGYDLRVGDEAYSSRR